MSPAYDLQIPLLKLSHHGGTRVLVELANQAAASGYRVRLLHPAGRVEKSYEFHPHLTVLALSCGPRWLGLDYLFYIARLLTLLRSGTLLANVFITFYPIWLAHKIYRRPYLYLVQDLETWFHGLGGSVLNALCRITWRSSRIVVVSPSLAQALADHGQRPLATVQVGVSECFFATPVALGKKIYDLIYFPRLESWKRLDRLPTIMAEAASRQRPLRVLCVAQDEALLEQCAALGCAILKPENDAALVAAFDQARLVLFTSDREGLGLPPLEGMARGLPAIVFDNKGIRTYMESGGNGEIFQAGQEVLATEAILRLLDDPPLWQRLSQGAQATAAKFRMAEAFTALLRWVPKSR